MKTIKGLLFSIVFMLMSSFANSQNEGDRIMAVIGDEIITESDFQYQVQLYARQNQLTELNPYIAQQIFQSMVTEKIILAKAEQDSISLSDEEINRELDNRINTLVGQMGSEKALTDIYGMSIARIRLVLREDLEKKMKVDKLKRQKLRTTSKITDKDVREFFETYRDSLPEVKDEYEIYRIYLTRSVSDAERQQARYEAQKILDSLRNGADFSEMARKYSQDSLSAIQGGDLGTAKRGMFVKEFEEAAFSLSEGEVSGLVETEYGVHIIKLIEKKGETISAKHILIRYPRLESSDFETINFLKDLKRKIQNGDITFEEAAKQYSEDPNTNTKGGYVGRISVDQISPDLVKTLEETSDGTITDPVKIGDDVSYGYAIIKKIEKYPAHELTLSDDYDRIKRYAEAFKENKELEKWINELRETIYVDIRI